MTRPRGLCWADYHQPEVLALYPPGSLDPATAKFAAGPARTRADFEAACPRCEECGGPVATGDAIRRCSTCVRPAAEQPEVRRRIAEYQRRVDAGEPLFPTRRATARVAS